MYRTLIIFILFFFPTGICWSQDPGISVSSDKNKILLGEPFHLNLKAVYPSGLGVNTGFDSIPHFEFTEAPQKDSTVTDQLVTMNIVYTVTSFDSGHWVIPSLVLNQFHSDSIPMDVQFSDFDTSQPYHSIKDIVAAPEPENSQWWWYIMGAVLLLALLLFYFLRRKRKPILVAAKEFLDPYKEAMLELKKIGSENLEPKLYYSKLVLVLRIYLKRKKNMQSLQKTTADLIIKMKELPLQREEMDKVSQTLRMADMVKFAKFIPEAADREHSFEVIRSCIDKIESASISQTQA